MRLALVSVLVAAVLAGCGSDDDLGNASLAPTTTPSTTAARPAFDPVETGSRVMSRWSSTLLSTFSAAGKQGQALKAGRQERAVLMQKRFLRGLRKIERFGSEAQRVFRKHPSSREARAIKASGRAWSAWARAVRTPTASGITRIAALAKTAVRRQKLAYRAIGEDVPARSSRPRTTTRR
ncbi:hypothetical protein [Conexibacter sp. SYSU D00693]|uniref:hypothetical protein n=1 Tax=Conexibacter sp. SYSU D00693 TaxID=2812560 RepID=UPI00196B2D11|nr:hypothetical protein [Conexibacter sp. SYSU D00693]